MHGREEIDGYTDLSLKLYNVLECIGISKDVRRIRTETMTIAEILGSFAGLPHILCYICGSAYEGSSTLHMGSDIDMVCFSNELPVVCNTDCISNMSYPYGMLLIPDNKCPGYAKLQLICDGKVQYKHYKAGVFQTPSLPTMLGENFEVQADSKNRLCITCKPLTDSLRSHGYHQHGPALQANKGTCMSYDFVTALQCDAWPQVATEWLTRRRKYEWPSSDLIQKMETYGFIVVPASHPQSDEKHLQWRLSFSLQERLLVVHFNSVQMKCYVLLKVIKTKINNAIGEETLTSYHCKTCMFYMLETTSNELWVPEHFVSCLLMCLKQIRSWVMNGNLPNYFIPGENMLDRITNKDLLKTLVEMIENVINSDLKNLIPTLYTVGLWHDMAVKYNSSAGEAKAVMDTIIPQRIRQANKSSHTLLIINLLANTRNRILMEHYSSNIERFTDNIMILMLMLSRTNMISDYAEAETTTAKSLIMPFLELQLLTNSVVKQLSGGNDEARKTLESSQWDTLESTGISKLKQAAILLALRDNNASLHALLHVAQRCRVSICFCDPCNTIRPTKYVQDEALAVVFKHTLVPCVSFLPTEQLITPLAIKYEMLRAFGVPIEHRDMTNYYWFDWGMVDGTFLTLFLAYLNHVPLDHTSEARKCVKRMILLLNKGPISHRETCLNLLGWIHREKGNVDLAVQCFAKSLKERPRYNAAYWHYCFLICEPQLEKTNVLVYDLIRQKAGC